MIMRRAVRWLGVALSAGLTMAIGAQPPRSTAAPASTTRPPNIIVLLADDLGWQDMSVALFRDTTAANRRYTTPAIAALARSGVTFTDAYATAPVGAPTRIALLTGRSPLVTHVTDDSLVLDRDVSRHAPALLSPAWRFQGLRADSTNVRQYGAPLLPALLRRAGYRTIHVGGSGWAAAGAPSSDARAIGFDETMADAVRADSLTAMAIHAMDAARVNGQSFFLWLSYRAFRDASADPRFVGEAQSRGLDVRTARYASHVQAIDESVRNIAAFVDSTVRGAPTIIVFLSDNGGSGVGAFANAPLSGRMGSGYEGGLRIPLIVRWPGVARAGLRVHSPVTAEDLFPTLLRAARIPNATTLTRGLFGVDLASTMDNSKPVDANRALVWHYPHVAASSGRGIEPFSAIRVGPWKLIYWYVGSRYELFNVASDIGEARERSLTEAAIAAPLSTQLRARLSTTNAQLPVDSSYRRPVPLPGRLLLLPERPVFPAAGTRPPSE
ncbi:MAG: sulfatase-like hydrolase/transferase [Gemmatimonadaceae bacterium]|nr:sulfatase-like hydrolase/transferase [Gemmatimonadaceae bacterium]